MSEVGQPCHHTQVYKDEHGVWCANENCRKRLGGEMNVLNTHVNTHGIPDHTFGALARYIDYRLPPGDFLRAVLTQDYELARALADDTNAQHLGAIFSAVSEMVPRHARGTEKAVRLWLQGR